MLYGADMTLTACNRRAFLGLAAGTALAGVAILTSGRAAASFEVQYSEAEWRRRLGPARYRILREAGTERAVHQPAAQGASQGHLRLRRLRPAAVQLGDQVRQRHRLAELLRALPNAVVTGAT